MKLIYVSPRSMRGQRVERARGKKLGPAAGKGRRSRHPSGWCTSASANGGSVLATFKTITWSSASAFTNAARSAAMRSTAWRADCCGLGGAPVRELRDGVAGPEMRCRDAPVRVAAASSSLQRGEPAGLKNPGRARGIPRPIRRTKSRGCRGRRSRNQPGSGSGKPSKHGQLGDEPRAVGQASAHRGQAHRDRRTDASKGAN